MTEEKVVPEYDRTQGPFYLQAGRAVTRSADGAVLFTLDRVCLDPVEADAMARRLVRLLNADAVPRRFRVTVQEVASYAVEVEAASPEEAEEVAKDRIADAVTLSPEDGVECVAVTDREVQAVEEVPCPA